MRRGDAAACEAILAASGSNFAVPLRLLPAERRRGSIALYAFCRLADDIVDDALDERQAAARLDRFEQQLSDGLAGLPVADPVLRAIAATAGRFAIPPRHLFAVIAGVRADLTRRRYETVADLVAYCRQVASAVGLAAVPIWGLRDGVPPADWMPAADACGLAFQWTNILRDIVEDRGRGRIYLPRESFVACGCEPAWLDGPVGDSADPGFAALAAAEAARCRRWFAEAARLDAVLSADGQRVFRAMYGVYGELFRAVETAGAEIFFRRVRPPRWRLLLGGLACLIGGPQ